MKPRHPEIQSETKKAVKIIVSVTLTMTLVGIAYALVFVRPHPHTQFERPAALGGLAEKIFLPPTPNDYRFIRASSLSISSITPFIFFMVMSNGCDVVISTPAFFRRSIGYSEPPAERKSR